LQRSLPQAVRAGRGALTERMIEVARVAATGKTNKEIGRLLGISDRTVSTTLSEAYKRLKLTNRGQLAEWVRRGNLLDRRRRSAAVPKPARKRPTGSTPRKR